MGRVHDDILEYFTMNMRNTQQGYGLIAKLLHWLIAVSIIALIPIGWYMTGLSDEDVWYWRLLDFHELLGLVLLVVVPLKYVWMVYSPSPPYSSELTAWERRAARAVHVFFLIAMAIIPLSGFLFVATNGEPIELYGGIITIPDIGEFSKGVRDMLGDVHYYLSYGCAALIVLHLLAALKHQFVDGGDSLRRMTF